MKIKNNSSNKNSKSAQIPVQFSSKSESYSSKIRFVNDYIVPNAPLVSFDVALLAGICLIIFPDASLQLRSYLVEKVLDFLTKQIKEYQQRLTVYLPVDTSTSQSIGSEALHVINKLSGLSTMSESTPETINTSTRTITPYGYSPEYHGININGLNVIPIYMLLYSILEEWRLIPRETKETFGNIGATRESLKKLNEIYDNNCEIAKKVQAEILEAKLLVGNCETSIIQLEKTIRRLTRKWEEQTSTDDEFNDLQNAKIALNETKTSK